nr:2,3-dihydro-2,3-dihydroxybenzoate dehydrogenase [Klebsiella pneumoniae]
MLVNAAGILRMGATDQLSAEDWQQTFAVNVGGAFNLFQQTMAQFRRQRAGRSSPSPPMPRTRRASA